MTGFQITSGPTTVPVGQTLQLAATREGTPVTPAWASSAPALGTVDPSGLFTAVAPGGLFVEASLPILPGGALSAIAFLTVTP